MEKVGLVHRLPRVNLLGVAGVNSGEPTFGSRD